MHAHKTALPTHLPLTPLPPSARICPSCRPSPAARCCSSPSSRRCRPSAARTCVRIPGRGQRRLPGEPEPTRQHAERGERGGRRERERKSIVKFSCAIHMHMLSKATHMFVCVCGCIYNIRQLLLCKNGPFWQDGRRK